jgi:hypothetical protein
MHRARAAPAVVVTIDGRGGERLRCPGGSPDPEAREAEQWRSPGGRLGDD